jgi:hypothetical protein
MLFDADMSVDVARLRLNLARRRAREVYPPPENDALVVGEAEMTYFAAVEEARAIRLRLAWRERLDLLRVFDEVEQSWHGAP